LALAVAATVVIVDRSLAPAGADRPDVPRCGREVEPPVTCRTRSAVLRIGIEGQPIVFDDTQVRVLHSRVHDRRLEVVLRLRNETGTAPRAAVGRGQVYARVGGTRLPILSVRRRSRDGGPTVLAHFRLPGGTARDAPQRAELGVVPWNELDERRPDRLAVVRLSPQQKTPHRGT
jgi:hypothetical protein